MHPDKRVLEEVVAVIVTYNPDQRFPKSAAEVARQVGKIIIVDNGSNLHALRMVREVAFSLNAELMEHKTNLGIAAALNQGVRKAISQGYAWIITLDQDSQPESGMVEKLIAAYWNHPRREAVALVAPVIVDRDSGRSELAELCNGRKSVELTMAFTSGSLIDSKIFASAGFFREDFFIDYIDAEFCLRIRKLGYTLILACGSSLLHKLGDPSYHKFLWRSGIVTNNHSPRRRYYMVRNRILTIKEYAIQEPAWAFYEIRAFCKEIAKMMLFEHDKINKVRYCGKGTIDAFLGRTGKIW